MATPRLLLISHVKITPDLFMHICNTRFIEATIPIFQNLKNTNINLLRFRTNSAVRYIKISISFLFTMMMKIFHCN